MNFKSHHVAFTVKNTKQSIEWYKNKLGFRVIHKYNKNGMEITLLKLGDVKLELFCFGKETKSLPNHRRVLMDDLHVIGAKHLCIEVDNLDHAIKELKEKGVKFATDIDTAGFGGRYIFIKDCSDILIELYQS